MGKAFTALLDSALKWDGHDWYARHLDAYHAMIEVVTILLTRKPELIEEVQKEFNAKKEKPGPLQKLFDIADLRPMSGQSFAFWQEVLLKATDKLAEKEIN